MTEPKEKRACPLRVLRHQVTPARRLVIPSRRLVIPSRRLVIPSRRLVTPSRRLVIPSRRFVTYRSTSGKFTVRRAVSLPFVER